MFNDSHISITTANDIKEICQPLFKHSNITLFKFMRVFSDGSYIILGSNADFVKKLSGVTWSSEDLKLIKSQSEPGKRYFLSNTCEQIPACILPITEEFRTEYGLLIKETYISYQDNFRFSTASKSFNIYDYFFNNVDFIEKFIFYFKDKAAPIIKKATKAQKLYFPEPEAYTLETMVNKNSAKVLRDDLKVSKYIFTLSEKLISLSPQEMNSVRLLAKGHTIKEAAQFLGISPRTVDYYLRGAREKLKATTNRQLLSIYWEFLSLA